MDFDRFGLWLAPDYITDLLTPYEPECILRSSDRGLLVIPWSRLRTETPGETEPLESEALQLLNGLLEEIRQASTISSF